MGKKVELSKIVEKFGLRNLTPEVSYENRYITIPDLAGGFFITMPPGFLGYTTMVF